LDTINHCITKVACASTRTHESTGEYVDDSVITTKVKTLLANDAFFKSFQISVETYKGIVQLSGFVNSQQAVDKAAQIARSVQAVQRSSRVWAPCKARFRYRIVQRLGRR
jgi:osmotically-inducible protein OsmY